MITREIFLQKRELKREAVTVPELGAVQVSRMTAKDRDRFELLTAKSDKGNIRARLAAFTVVDEAGKRLFTEADIPALGELDALILDPIADKALSLNRFTAADVEVLEKN